MNEIIKKYSRPYLPENNDLGNRVEEIKIFVTGLIGIDDNLDYDDLLHFKRNILEGGFDKIKELSKGVDILKDKNRKILKNYKNELYESALYGTPLNESEKDKLNLKIGEELYNIVNGVDDVLKLIKEKGKN